MRAIKINVTRAHIRDGEKGSESGCPIALALKDTLLTESVHVSVDRMTFNNLYVPTNEKDRRFIERFDKGLKVSPYSFDINRKRR